MHIRSLVLAGTALCSATIADTARGRPPAPASAAAPAGRMLDFARQIDIPHQQFELPNGLKVIVNTDRSTPVVAVSVWYDVGSKHEPRGMSGFAHLFEHLMFNGSENNPGDYFKPLRGAGMLSANGTTSDDRTNYYETVPTGSLERVLFMESDRMGYLLGAVSQSVLDEQRDVVKNEKRNGENSPYAIIGRRLTTRLYPADHPYGHSTIGSMADLDAAGLADVRGWFRNHYGPNNALLVLAGDIDVATARTLVERYFGDIPRGPETVKPRITVPTLPRPLVETVTAPIASPVITRAWAVPGYDDTDALGLDIAAGVLTSIDGAPLERELVRRRKLFSSIRASNATSAQGGVFQIGGRVAAGVDPAVAGKALDDLLVAFLAKGTTADDIERWATNFTIGYARQIEQASYRAEMMAMGALYLGDAAAYRRDLTFLNSQTPASVLAIARRWLGRPAYALTVTPGPRIAEVDPPRIASAAAQAQAAEGSAPVRRPRMAMPAVGEPTDLRFPAVARVRLSNGIEVVHALKTSVPFTSMSMVFDAGRTADSADRLGLHQLTLSALDKGAAGHDESWIARRKERYGLSLSAFAGYDESSVSLTAPSVNLIPATQLMGMVVKQPSFPRDEVERLKRETLVQIANERTDPASLTQRVLPKLLDANSPYAKAAAGLNPHAVARFTPADLVGVRQQWLRPDQARIYVVSDRPLAEMQAVLEHEFGHWTMPGVAGRIPPHEAPKPAPPQVVLIDMPDAVQSIIEGGQVIAMPDDDAWLGLMVANSALGSGFLSRINMNLREDKHWAYGARGTFERRNLAAGYTMAAEVQKDRTGPAITEMRKELANFLTTKPMTQDEFEPVMAGALRVLAGGFQTAGSVLGAIQENDRLGRPDDYYTRLGAKYREMTPDIANREFRARLDPAIWVWTVVGDARVVRPQLDALGLPVRVVTAAELVPGG